MTTGKDAPRANEMVWKIPTPDKLSPIRGPQKLPRPRKFPPRFLRPPNRLPDPHRAPSSSTKPHSSFGSKLFRFGLLKETPSSSTFVCDCPPFFGMATSLRSLICHCYCFSNLPIGDPNSPPENTEPEPSPTDPIPSPKKIPPARPTKDPPTESFAPH